jgi:hypothetical protein
VFVALLDLVADCELVKELDGVDMRDSDGVMDTVVVWVVKSHSKNRCVANRLVALLNAAANAVQLLASRMTMVPPSTH